MKLPFRYHTNFGVLKHKFRLENSCAFFTRSKKYSNYTAKNILQLYKNVGATVRKADDSSQRNNRMTMMMVVVVVVVVVAAAAATI
jgi:hypothetical protein